MINKTKSRQIRCKWLWLVMVMWWPALSFGAMVEVTGHTSDGRLVFQEGRMEFPIMVNGGSPGPVMRDGLNQVMLGYGGKLYDPGEPFGPYFAVLHFPFQEVSGVNEGRRALRPSAPSWIGKPRLLNLNSGYPTTPHAGIGTLRRFGRSISDPLQGIGVALEGTATTQAESLEAIVTVQGTVLTQPVSLGDEGFHSQVSFSPQVLPNPLPGAVWLFGSGLGILVLWKRRMARFSSPGRRLCLRF